MVYKMKGWSGFSPLKQEVKSREGEVYVIDKMAVVNDPVMNTKEFSDEPMYEGQLPSTHLMAWDKKDGKFYAFPTLFQDNSGNWYKGGKESFNEAVRKNEIHEFDTEEAAKAFAAGSWKDKHFGTNEDSAPRKNIEGSPLEPIE